MIRTQLHDGSTGRVETGGEELIEAWRVSTSAILWLDLMDVPEAAESSLMQERFGLHPLAIQDAQRQRHPPKIEGFDDHTFVLMKGLNASRSPCSSGRAFS